MKSRYFIWLLAPLFILSTAFLGIHHREEIYNPDPLLTPGAVTDATAVQVCVPGYSAGVRNVPERDKRKVYDDYHRKRKAGKCCEVDHLISLELGGSNDVSNLWPQPYPQAYWKDQAENYLHREVCAGRMTLATAQKEIATNWYGEYLVASDPNHEEER